MPRPSAEAKSAFQALVPVHSAVTMRPMFGNLAAFVNGNMFLALFGSDVAVRLADEDRAELLAEEGASLFAPMPGRAMKEYVVVPPAWRDRPDRVVSWVDRSLAWTASLPPKKR